MKCYRIRSAGAVALLLAGGVSAQQWQALPDAAPTPPDNPTTPEKVELGRRLFFDPRLSPGGETSCTTCHVLEEGGDDNGATSQGTGGRSAPTVWNAGFHSVLFWDGRASSLEELLVSNAPNHTLDVEAIGRIGGYRPLFQAAFGGAIKRENTVRALAAFLRALVTSDTPYDRFAKGDQDALNAQQKAGMQVFARLGCMGCHMGPVFNGPPMPPGTGFFMKFPTFPDSPWVSRYGLAEDPGRFAITGQERDRHLWRVPTLRNVALTAPYFHNGSVATLEEAVRVMAGVQLNRELSEQEVTELVAFLHSLGGELPQRPPPELP